MKKSISLIAVLLCFAIIGLNAQVFKTVRVDNAGTLYSLLTPGELDSITDLKLTGTINSDDFITMKDSMPSLTGIDLESVRAAGDSIAAGAFNPGISSLILPSSLKTVGYHSLQGCAGLTTLTIPSGVRSIGDYALTSCTGLTSVSLPESLKSIGNLAFAGCSSLLSIHLPDSLLYIGRQAFAGCSGMKSIAIPNQVTSLGENAFAGCSWLDSISIGTSVTSIGMNAFAGCSSLRSVIIPPSVDSIAPFAFVGCQGLTSVTILSSSETTIGEYAFAGNAGLVSVTIHPSPGTSIGRYAFVSCTSLKELNMLSPSVTSIGEGCFINSSIDTLVLPGSLTSIGKYAFINNDSLKTLTFLPSSGKASIGENAFGDCSNLVSVTFLPSSGTSIGKIAFNNCSRLVSVYMSSPSVDSIGERCFQSCPNFTSLTIPSSLVYIGNYAFYYCKIAGSLTMPATLTYIGEYAFASCKGIDSLTFMPSSGTSIGPNAFYNCDGLTSLIMYSPSVDYIGLSGFEDSGNLTSVILPSSLVSLAPGVFGRCYGLKKIRINRMIPPVPSSYNSIFTYLSTGAIDLYIPAGTKEAYQGAAIWSGFNIVEFDLQLSASPDTLAIVDTTGSTAFFDITSSTNWQVISDQTWLTAEPQIGLDTASIKLVAETNPDTVVREAIITVSGENVESRTVIVIQAPRPELSVSSDTLDIGPLAGSTAHFNIVSNQDWTAQSDAPWLGVSASSGYKNGEITLTAEANPDTTAREAIVIVNTGRLTPQTIIIIQAPKSVLSVSTNILVIGSMEGNNALFHITSNTSWTIQSDQPWLTVNPSSGSGNREIMLTAEANPEVAIREAIVTVSSDGLPSQTITITQEGALPTGTKETTRRKIEVYPNPVQDVLYVSGGAGKELFLYDLKGRVIFSQRISDDHETVDLSMLPYGNYLIRIGDMTLKIVK